MPLTLPGLFDFTTGVSSAINQQNNRAVASGNEALSFVNQLNAFNQALNTNDNLEFRQDFASQPDGTSILDRFTNIATQTNNPFTLNQAVTQQQSLAPLLALTAAQNPFFAQQQGLPSTAQGALQGSYLGFQPQFQQQRNLDILRALGTNNLAPNASQNADVFGQAQLQAIENQRIAQAQQAQRDAEKRANDIQKQLNDVQRRQNATTPTTPNTASANLGLPDINFRRPPTIQPSFGG